ncbi:MAG: helix-turn-helix domain-containing protein [Thermomicrobiales bacterium]
MIYARQPSDEECEELRRMIRQEAGRVSQRARLILLSSQRRTTTELAEIFSSDKVTVRRWVHRFNQLGPSGLYDEPRPGRPRKVGQPAQDEVSNDALVPAAPMAPRWSPAAGVTLQPPIPTHMSEDRGANLEETASLATYAVRHKPRPQYATSGRRRFKC